MKRRVVPLILCIVMLAFTLSSCKNSVGRGVYLWQLKNLFFYQGELLASDVSVRIVTKTLLGENDYSFEVKANSSNEAVVNANVDGFSFTEYYYLGHTCYDYDFMLEVEPTESFNACVPSFDLLDLSNISNNFSLENNGQEYTLIADSVKLQEFYDVFISCFVGEGYVINEVVMLVITNITTGLIDSVESVISCVLDEKLTSVTINITLNDFGTGVKVNIPKNIRTAIQSYIADN